MNAAVSADFEALIQRANTTNAVALGHTPINRLHPRVLGLTVATYLALVAAFAIGFTGSVELAISLGIVFVVAAAGILLPWAMAREGSRFWARHDQPEAPADSFRAFLNGNFETAAGKVSGRGAVALVLTVPVCLTLGVIAMAIIARVV